MAWFELSRVESDVWYHWNSKTFIFSTEWQTAAETTVITYLGTVNTEHWTQLNVTATKSNNTYTVECIEIIQLWIIARDENWLNAVVAAATGVGAVVIATRLQPIGRKNRLCMAIMNGIDTRILNFMVHHYKLKESIYKWKNLIATH